MSVFTQLNVPDPVPLVFDAPALPHQAQHGFGAGSQCGEEIVGLFGRLAVAAAGGEQLHDPAGAGPVLLDVLRRFPGPQDPGRVAPMPFLVIHCSERDLTLSLELAADLPVQGLLVALDRQEHVGPLGEAPVKNDCVVCSASAWIRTPSRSRPASSSLRAARSLDSPVSYAF